jgi:hypothetical protein
LSELDDLRRRNIELERENAALRSPAPRRFPLRPGSLFQMPELVTLLELKHIALTAYPVLKPDASNASEFQTLFDNAFFALGHMPRTPDGTLNLKIDRTEWTGRAQEVLHRIGCMTNEVRIGPFTAALVAHHDIAHSPLARWPYDLAFGLGNHTGTPATDKWRALILSKKVRGPTALPQARQEPAQSQVKVRLSEFSELKNHF